MISSALFRFALRIRWAGRSFLRDALIFSGPMKRPASSGSWSGDSGHLRLDCDANFFDRNWRLNCFWQTRNLLKFL